MGRVVLGPPGYSWSCNNENTSIVRSLVEPREAWDRGQKELFALS